MKIDYYEKPNGRFPVQDFIRKLPARDRVLVMAAIAKLEEHGRKLNRPHAGYLRDHIRELRPDNQRVLYFVYHEGKAVLLHAITKKARKVADADINKAIEYKADYLRRHPKKGKK